MKAKKLAGIAIGVFCCILLAATAIYSASSAATADISVYADALGTGFQDWSWDTQTNYSNPTPHHAGSTSIAVTYTAGWGGLQIGHWPAPADVDISAYDTFRFWINGGSSGGQVVQFQFGDLHQDLHPLANTWTQVDISLLSLGTPRSLSPIIWKNNSSGTQPTFYLDDLAFLDSGSPTPTPLPPGVGPHLTVDAAAGQHPISSYIYGINFPSEAVAQAVRLPVARWGGNSTSRYNWQNNTTNTGSDWYFENIVDSTHTADAFIQQNIDTGTQTLLTMPLIGWVAKNSPANHPFNCAFKVSQYGPQEDTDPWDPDCGNGVSSSGTEITGNNPLDTSVAVTPAFATGWVNHLLSTFGSATTGGVRFYDLDNEPMLWNSTHRDVHPAPTSYDELRDRAIAYAAAIKAADPGAQILGPATWGWCAYFYSAVDGCSPGADRAAHNNMDFTEWYLQQLHAYDQAHGTRLLDYVDVHIYPQVDGVFADSPGSAAVQAARLRSTRQLWDPSYVHEGWIAQPVYLIPRMRAWVANNYPGTKVALSEYNWGALGYINGALAEADILGIFGREGLDLATLWGPPDNANAPGIFAFRMYRNYDGAGAAFGETSLQAASADQEKLAVYAARRASDGALTLMIINKTGQTLTSSLQLASFTLPVSASVWRYSSVNLAAIVRQPDQPLSPTGFSATYPANSITLLVLPSTTPPHRIYLPAIIR
jgi:hypothetical protein